MLYRLRDILSVRMAAAGGWLAAAVGAVSFAAVLVVAAAFFVACGRGGAERGFALRGAWVQTAVMMPGGEVVEYPNSSGFSHLFVFENDSVLFTSQVQFTQAGTLVNPEERGEYRLLYKGGGEYLFLRDGMQLDFRVVGDSVFTVREMGLERTFARDRRLSAGQIEEVKRMTIEGREGYQCMFSKGEERLRMANDALTYIIVCVAAVLAAVGAFAWHTHRGKRLIEERLRQLMEEREMRPAEVRTALEIVEREFLESDYYRRLKKHIEDGMPLKDGEFGEIEREMRRVYPGFFTSLESLCKMSVVERQVCMLIKLRVSPSDIATALCKSSSAISSVRSRLFQKVFQKKGSTADWDDFILKM